MKRIGILGGTFNPIHMGHIYMAQQAKEYLHLDEVIFMPNRKSPFKSIGEVSFEDRYAMCQLAITKMSGMVVSDLEGTLPLPSYTISTIEELRKGWVADNEDVELFFLIGDDHVELLSLWKDIDILASWITFGIFVRREAFIHCAYPHVLIPCQTHPASSTAIREGDFRQLHPAVKDYIVRKELYLREIVRQRLTKKRYQHTLSVREVALTLARIHGLDLHKVSVAAYFHDIAKEISSAEMARCMIHESKEARQLHPAIHHQFASAQFVSKQLLIDDEDIITAIRCHTSGGENPYTKVLFVADKIEPLRGYDVSEEWALVQVDLDAGYELVKQKQEAYIKKENIDR